MSNVLKGSFCKKSNELDTMMIKNQSFHGFDNQFLCKWSNLLDCDYINQSIQSTERQFLLGVEKQQTDTVGIKNQSIHNNKSQIHNLFFIRELTCY